MNEATHSPMLIARKRPFTTADTGTGARPPLRAARNASDSGSLAHITGRVSSPRTPPTTNMDRHPSGSIRMIASSAVSTAPTW